MAGPDGREFLDFAVRAGIRPVTGTYRLAEASAALTAVRLGQLEGAAVLIP